MLDERELAIHPIVPESVQHNSRVRSSLPKPSGANLHQVVSNIRNITASLFGIVAGTLGLESYPGFAFYLVGTTLVSALLYLLRADGKPQSYFYSPVNDLWMGDITTGIMSFMLTWTLFYGIVRAQ
jgi:hypothetical protein